MINPYALKNKAREQIHGVDSGVDINAQSTLTNPPTNDQHWSVRALATGGNFISNILEGAIKSIEGIVDAGAMLVGLFGADVDDFVSYDFTSDIFGTDEEGEGLLDWAWGRNLSQVSYLDDSSMINQIAEGIGGMLPTVALALATAGTSLAGTATAQALQTASFVASASGKASEEAFKEGANYGQALGYGALSGATEGLLEYIGGRTIGKVVGESNTLLSKSKFVKKLTETTAGKIAYNFASEGLEEVASDLIDPFYKRATGVDKEAKVDWSQLPKTFIVGGATGAVMDGLQSGLSSLRHSKQGGKHYTKVAENVQDIVKTTEALEVIQQSQKVSQEELDKAITRSTEKTIDAIENISTELKEMKEEQRTEAFKTFREHSNFLDNTFNADGSIKDEVMVKYNEVMNNGAKYNVTSNLIYKQSGLEEDIKLVNEQYGKNIELSDTKFNTNQRRNFARINRSIANLNNKTNRDLSVIVIKDDSFVDAKGNKHTTNAFIDGDKIYINEAHLEDGKWAKHLAHEISHFAFKSKDFDKFAKYIASSESELVKSINEVIKNYEFEYTEQEAKSIVEAILSGKKVSNLNDVVLFDEVVANLTEKIFMSEESINRLARENTTLAQKLLNSIKDLLSLFKGTNADFPTVIKLRKAEKLFEKALDSIGKETRKAQEEYRKAIKGQELSEETEEELDNKKDIRYSNTNQFNEIIIDDKQEYTKLSQALAFKNGKKPNETEFAFTDKYFYVVTNNTFGNFKPILQVEINGNEELIKSIKENINNGAHRKATTIAEWLGIVQSGTRSDNRDNDYIATTRRNGYVNGLYDEESKSNTRRNSIKNGRNKTKVIEYDFENRIMTYRDGTKVRFSQTNSKIDNEYYTLLEKPIENELKLRSLINEQAKKNGYTKEMFHETDAENIHIFDITLGTHGSTDSETPYGIFTKSTDKNIGLGSRQMALFVKADNTLSVMNRAEVKVKIPELVPYYDEIAEIDKKYDALVERLSDIELDALQEWMEENPNVDMDVVYPTSYIINHKPADIDYPKYQNAFVNREKAMEEWKTEYNKVAIESKKVITSYLRNNGYDSMYFVVDGGSRGRQTDSLIVLDENQVKSADTITYDDNGNIIPLSQRFNSKTKDIRFSKSKEELPDFDTVASLDKWFDNLSFEELQELVNDIDEDIKDIVVEPNTLTKQERRELFVKKLYEQGNLDKVVTKIVKSKPQMEKYFSNTKMNNKYNPLIPSKSDEYVVMFHGTPEEFYEFDTKKVGKHGSVMGSGLYFTSSLSYAEDYKDNDNGRVIATLLNIEKPLSRNKKTITKDQLKTFISKVVDSNGEDYLSNYGDVYSLGYDKLLDKVVNQLYDYNTNDADLIEDVYITSRMDFDEFHDGLTDTLGYDGIIAWNKAEGTQAVVFKSNQVKEIFNFAPTKSKDIRFSQTKSEGQVQKQVANYTREKVYTKAEAEHIINFALQYDVALADYIIDINNSNKQEVINALWVGLNSLDEGKRTGLAFKIADFIIDNSTYNSLSEMDAKQEYADTVAMLKPYFHKIDTSGIKDEIKYHYDTDKSVYALWSNKNGMPADKVAQELANKGYVINAENEADIFVEIVDAYKEASSKLKDNRKQLLKDALSDEEVKNMRQEIAKEILRGFDTEGTETAFAKTINKYMKQVNKWKDLFYDAVHRNKAVNTLLENVKQLTDLKQFQNSTEFQDEQFKGSVEKLGKLNWRGNLNESGARNLVLHLNNWYNPTNEVIGNLFDQDIKDDLEAIASGLLSNSTGALTTEEIKVLSNVVTYFKKFVEEYHKVRMNGKMVDAIPLVENYYEKIEQNEKIKLGGVGQTVDKVFDGKKHSYYRKFGDPMAYARYLDKYDDGFYTQAMEMFRQGAVNSAILEKKLYAPLEEFSSKNKKYFKTLNKRNITYMGKEIPCDIAIGLYMTLHREQAILGLARNGFKYVDKDNNTQTIDGFEPNIEVDFDGLVAKSKEQIELLKKQFSEADLEYIKILEKQFEKCKEYKKERDIAMRGYSNVVDGYYYPIKRYNVAKSIDTNNFFGDDRVSNLSFNKDSVKGASQTLMIDSVVNVSERHFKGIAMYYSLAEVIRTYDVLYTLDIGGNKNNPKNIKSKTLQGIDKYFREMLNDIQGISKGETDAFWSFLRGGFAKYQLGANPKVWITQLSSFFASTSILDFKSVVKGLGIKGDDVDKYCKLAELRNTENTIALAQGNIEQVGKVGDFFMKPIGMMDRQVIKKLFGACQVQIAKEKGLEVGTEANKQEAGKLLEKVILETQQNSLATERSQAMRSTSEIMKMFTMFTSDAMKVFGRLVDGVGKVSVLKAKIRMTTDANTKTKLEAELKKANKQLVKAVGASVSQAVFMAIIAELFKHFYNRDEEDENIATNITLDTLGNMVGGLPIVKDIVNFLTDGYTFNNFAIESLNDLLEGLGTTVDMVGDIFNGTVDKKELASNIRKISYALGQLFGIPARNIYNVIYGSVNTVSESGAYKVDNFFKKQNYSSDLKKAIAKGDTDMIATITGLITDENVGTFENSNTRKELNRLASQGFDILPQTIPDSVTIDDEVITLTNSQKNAYKKVYNQSVESINKLVSSKGYSIASDEAKAKAIKYVYKYYYYEAQAKTFNTELDSKLYLFGQVIQAEKLALALAEAPLLANNTTNKKKVVERYLQGSNLTSVQKYMLMGYFGYKNTRGESAVKSAINKTSLTKAQKELLLEKCGY